MARRRYRKTRSRRGRRGFRRRSRVYKKIASLNRRLAAEVKKNDNAVQLLTDNFTQLTSLGLHDYAYIYPVVDATMKQGNQLDDIIGESIKLKYLYLGFHLQQMCNTTAPVTLRIMIVQDRNYTKYQQGVPTIEEMFTNLFGMNNANTTATYASSIDATLLPLNPLEPGRFQVLRDFKMRTSPSGSADNYKKVMIVQSKTNSHGRIYFGPSTAPPSGQVAWTNPVGIFLSSGDPNDYLMFDYPVTGSAQRLVSESASVQYGRWAQYQLPVGNIGTSPLGESFVNGILSSQYPYPVSAAADSGEPGDVDVDFSSSRNGIYVVILRQSSPIASGNLNQEPTFSLAIQSRLAYYDN